MGVFFKSAEEKYQKGLQLLKQEEYKKARKQFEAAAKYGHADAAYRCGLRYEREDEKRALAYLEQAAEQGHAAAQYKYGRMLCSCGDNGGIKWLMKADEQGYAPAALACADELYRSGECSAEECAQALVFAEKAAAKGDKRAALVCTDICCDEKIHDRDRALYWMENLYLRDPNFCLPDEADATRNYHNMLKKWMAERKFSIAELREKGGAAYQEGNYLKAAQLLEAPAENGDAEAAMLLFDMYESDKGRLWYFTDTKLAARKYLLLSAEYGSTEAIIRCTQIYLENLGKKVKEDDIPREKLLQWLQRSAERGDSAETQYLYGGMLGWGKGEPWYLKAAEQGHVEAQFVCASCYFSRDVEKSFYWAEKAANAGHKEAQELLERFPAQRKKQEANAAYRAGDFSRAYALYEQLYESGDTELIHILAGMCLKGEGLAPNPEKAVGLYERAYSLGGHEFAHNLAELYLNGEGVEQNVEKAVGYYEQAIADGYTLAACMLGKLYDEGRGVPQDKKKALELYEKSGENDRDRFEPIACYARLRCAEMYAGGEGTEVNREKAIYWGELLIHGRQSTGWEIAATLDGTETGDLLRLRVGLTRFRRHGYWDDFTVYALKAAADAGYLAAFLPMSVITQTREPDESRSYFLRWLCNAKPGDHVVFGRFPQDEQYYSQTPQDPIHWTILEVQSDRVLLLCNRGLLFYDHTLFFGEHDGLSRTLPEMVSRIGGLFEDTEEFLVQEQRMLTPDEFERYILREKRADASVSATIYARTQAAHEQNLDVQYDRKSGSGSIGYMESDYKKLDQRREAMLFALTKSVPAWWLEGNYYTDGKTIHEKSEMSRNRKDPFATQTAVFRPAVWLRWPEKS